MSYALHFLLLFITLSFQTCEANSQGYNEDTRETLKSIREKSSCQPRETLVKVCDEFPEQIQYTIVPRCVAVMRCLGCCTDEATTCMPQKNKTVELQVLRVYSDKSNVIMLPFVMHTKCACRPRRNRLN
ncbi:snake venom vascular endothelial growth factor toxin HF isoform X2 [Tachysurus fulvidraco]|uniref:snake venom vascular endothelial growth factor toxin HF isoform X2 n=1 Tax=Tachysurus fulvidraco TaxID=1234273 RepID=UPI001FED42BF|nr:snake venom vascular endothelial growth factor toxin HF isoform X2 [Tachysurus fulvidraco]